MTDLIPRGAPIVSWQARADDPLHRPAFMGAMTEAARQGGASAVVVGPAITNPREITRALAAAIGDG